MFYGKAFGILYLLVEVLITATFAYLAVLGFLHHSLADTFIAIVLAAATGYAIHRRFGWLKEDRRLKDWLIANAERIRNNDPVFFRSQRIRMDTELVRHHLVLSAGVLSFRRQSRWIIKGREPRFGHALSACLYTLLYGWWGLPFGPFWSLVALVKNMKGSTTVRVADLLQPAPAKPVGFGDRFQADFSKRLKAGFFIDDKPIGILPPQSSAPTPITAGAAGD